MNNTVKVSGMEVKTKVSSNLLISGYDSTTYHGNEDEKYVSELTQEVYALIEPVSTVDGIDFYYTVDANAAGKKITSNATHPYNKYVASEAAVNSTAYKDKFSETYMVTPSTAEAAFEDLERAVPYVDYTFFLKATNTDSSNAIVAMTGCNLLYFGEALNSNATIGSDSVDSLAGQAWRVALFAVEVDVNHDKAISKSDLKTILTLSDADNWTSGQAVASTSALGDLAVEYNTAAKIDDTLKTGETKYYKVVVRLWLEGEDKSCNNETYAELTEAYSLNLEFKIGSADIVTPVTNISSDPVTE